MIILLEFLEPVYKIEFEGLFAGNSALAESVGAQFNVPALPLTKPQ